MREYFKIVNNGKISCIGISESDENNIKTILESLTINDNVVNPFEEGTYHIISEKAYFIAWHKFKFRKIRRLLAVGQHQLN